MTLTSIAWAIAVALLVPAGSAAGYDLAADWTSANRSDPSATSPGWAIADPTGTYVLGSRTAVRGRAPGETESVVLYARGDETWALLDLNEDGRRSLADAVPVGRDGRWGRRVVLSNASEVLTAPGQYSLAAVATADVIAADGTLPTTLPPEVIRERAGARTVVAVVSPAPEEPAVFADVAGQVATEDGVVAVKGIAPGSREVLVLAVDDRGTVTSDLADVDDDVFDEEVALVGPDGDLLSEGFTVGVVLSSGRDGRVGDGEIQGVPGADLAALEAYVQERTAAAPLSQRQVLEIIEAETVEDAGSDDLRLVDSFAFADARTTVDAVYPEDGSETGIRPVPVGTTMVVEGTTNRRPDDNTVFVDVVDESTGEPVAGAATERWGTDGSWSVRVSTTDLRPGVYTVRADDGADSDAVRVVVVGNASVG